MHFSHPSRQVTSQMGAFIRGMMQEIVCKAPPQGADGLQGGQLLRRKRLHALLRSDAGGLLPEDNGIDWMGELLSLAPEMVGDTFDVCVGEELYVCCGAVFLRTSSQISKAYLLLERGEESIEEEEEAEMAGGGFQVCLLNQGLN